MSEADVLLPEEEGVSVWVIEHTLATKLVADSPHAFNGLYKVAGLAKAVQVEGELSKLQGLCSWNYKRKKDWDQIRSVRRLYVNNTEAAYLLRRFSPVVSYLS